MNYVSELLKPSNLPTLVEWFEVNSSIFQVFR